MEDQNLVNIIVAAVVSALIPTAIAALQARAKGVWKDVLAGVIDGVERAELLPQEKRKLKDTIKRESEVKGTEGSLKKEVQKRTRKVS